MTKQKINLCNSLFYMLGVFTTIQLLSIEGVTVFNIVLILTAVIPSIINSKKLRMDKFFAFSVPATLVTLLLSIINRSLTSGFKSSAITEGIIYIMILTAYLLMNTKEKYAVNLVKGFKFSCGLTLGWCVLQLIFFYLVHIDINVLVFENFLKISGARSDYLNGVLIPSGFYLHRAILMPSLIFMFFSIKNPYLMMLIIIIGCLTKSTALIIGLLLALVFRIIIIIVNTENLHRKIGRKKIILALSIVLIIAIGCVALNSKISELASYVVTRFTDATTNKADNSSVVHFWYYKNLIPILKKMDLKSILFGTGFGTSGQHYTWFNGQYLDLESWVVESDYINILLSQGIIGLVLWEYVFLKLIILSKRYKFWENIAFVVIIAFVGIMYNIQFIWFIVIELGMLVLTKKKIRVFDVAEKKWRNKL